MLDPKMSLKSSAGKNPFGVDSGNPSPEGIEVCGSANNNSFTEQQSHGMANTRTDAGQVDEWEVVARKSISQGGDNAAKQWDSWRHPVVPPKSGLAANSESGEPHRNDGAARSGSFFSQSKVSEDKGNQNGKTSRSVIQGGSSGGYDSGSDTMSVQTDDDSVSDDFGEEIDDDISDNYDSDVSIRSHETRKKNKWFKVFFETLDNLPIDQINEPTRRWHCPACQHGPGSIAWYKGLQSLVTHAKTKGAERIRLHRELAELLEEELPMRGISVILAGEAFGRWKALNETTADHDIVWPPMVVVMNTVLEQDENDKWVGMGSQELLEYFPSYAAVKARHSYGPHGHRGISVLIFEASAIGYIEAEHLHKHFEDEGKDREAWEHHRVLFYPGGKRQLYGFLARKEDMDNFNRHSQGRFQLKFEMQSHQEMVMGPLRQMSKDNRQLVWLRNNATKLQQHLKVIEDTFRVLSQKVHETMEENRILRLRSKIQREDNKEEMDQQEQFLMEQMDKVRKATEEKEKIFKILLQEKHANARHHDADCGTKEERTLGVVESAKNMDNAVKEVGKFFTGSDGLAHVHEDYKMDLRERHLEDMLNAEKVIDDLTRAVEHVSCSFEASHST